MPRPLKKSPAPLTRAEFACRVTVSRPEAAGLLGCNVQTVDAYISRKLLRASKPAGGQRVLIRAESVEKMLRANEV